MPFQYNCGALKRNKEREQAQKSWWFIVNIVSKVWTTKKNSKHPHLPVEEQQSNPTVLLSMQKKIVTQLHSWMVCTISKIQRAITTCDIA